MREISLPDYHKGKIREREGNILIWKKNRAAVGERERQTEGDRVWEKERER